MVKLHHVLILSVFLCAILVRDVDASPLPVPVHVPIITRSRAALMLRMLKYALRLRASVRSPILRKRVPVMAVKNKLYNSPTGVAARLQGK